MDTDPTLRADGAADGASSRIAEWGTLIDLAAVDMDMCGGSLFLGPPPKESAPCVTITNKASPSSCSSESTWTLHSLSHHDVNKCAVWVANHLVQHRDVFIANDGSQGAAETARALAVGLLLVFVPAFTLDAALQYLPPGDLDLLPQHTVLLTALSSSYPDRAEASADLWAALQEDE